MGSVDCSCTLARQLQIHLDTEKKFFPTPWKWFSNRTRRRDRDSSISATSNGLCSSDVPKFPVDNDFLKTNLVDNTLSSAILLPSGVDLNEWLASQTIFIFESINMLCGCLSEFCTSITCPVMSGPTNIQYHWYDEKGKKCKCTAVQYIDCVTSYASSCIKDEVTFPTKYGNTFPINFHQIIKNIHRFLCHILVHTHQAHNNHIKALDLSPHYCTVLYHFLLFNKHFTLANPADLALFDEIFELLNRQTVKEKSEDVSSPPAQSHDNASCSAGDEKSSDLLNNLMPAQVMMTKSAGEEERKADGVAVDKYVPAFTIVT